MIDINWYPGHMTKAKRDLEKHLKMIDIVIQVLDARAPKSSLNPDFAPLFKGKKTVFVLNKSDLADSAITREWIAYFTSKNISAVAYSAARPNRKELISVIEKEAAEIRKKYADRGMNKTVRALVCGIPNVGKSAIINTLYGSNRLKVANKPGVTKSLSWVKIADFLELMDSPGLLWPKITDKRTGTNIALLGSINELILPEDELALYLIDMLKKTRPEVLEEKYRITDSDADGVAALEQICKTRGFVLKGNEYDYERAEKVLLDDFKNGRLGRISLERPEK